MPLRWFYARAPPPVHVRVKLLLRAAGEYAVVFIIALSYPPRGAATYAAPLLLMSTPLRRKDTLRCAEVDAMPPVTPLSPLRYDAR